MNNKEKIEILQKFNNYNKTNVECVLDGSKWLNMTYCIADKELFLFNGNKNDTIYFRYKDIIQTFIFDNTLYITINKNIFKIDII